MKQQHEFLQYLSNTSSDTIDFASRGQQNRLYRLVNHLTDCPAAERRTIAADPDTPLEFRIASLLQDSRRVVCSITHPVNIAIVFSMDGEHHRLHPRSERNPEGENALRVKLDQLTWLFDRSEVDWKLYAVDTGCSDDCCDCTRLIDEMIKTHPQGHRLQTVRLPEHNGVPMQVMSGNLQTKGSALASACELALMDGADAVIFTNANNTIHLGQLGNLLESFENGFDIVLGDCQDFSSILYEPTRHTQKGIKFLCHIKNMVGRIKLDNGSYDIKTALKLYNRASLKAMLKQAAGCDFTYAADWISAAGAGDKHVATRPMAFIDSTTESDTITQHAVSDWYDDLKGLVAQVRTHQVTFNENMCAVIDRQVRGLADIEAVIDYLPRQLEGAGADDLGDPALMPPSEIEQFFIESRQFQQVFKVA